jgi:hypothetical protein
MPEVFAWVMLVVFSWNSGITSERIGYRSERECRDAEVAMLKERAAKQAIQYQPSVYVYCIPGGARQTSLYGATLALSREWLSMKR